MQAEHQSLISINTLATERHLMKVTMKYDLHNNWYKCADQSYSQYMFTYTKFKSCIY